MSLEKSVRTCSVNTGEANRIQTDRFMNPRNMVCIPWNGLNNKGQEVSPDSFYTKTPGCDSAEDRVMVENTLRPQYFSYVTLGAQGVNGDLYGRADNADYRNAVGRAKFNKSRTQGDGYHFSGAGNFGTDVGAKVEYQGCSVGAYERGQAQMAQQGRQQAFLQNGFVSNSMRKNSEGFGDGWPVL